MKISHDRRSRSLSEGRNNALIPVSFWIVTCTLLIFSPLCSHVTAQNYLTSTGVSSFSAPYPAEMGTVDAASGNLHLEIPLGSFPQRGGSPSLVPRIIYDSHIWTLPTDGTSHVWTPTEFVFALPFGTWSFDEGGSQGIWGGPRTGQGCNDDYVSWDQSGVQHWFNIPGTWNGSQCSGGTAYAADSSGFQLRQTAWGSGVTAHVSLYAPDGTEVYSSDLDKVGIAAKDSNGNYLGLTVAGSPEFPGAWDPVIDTVGRKVVDTVNGNPTILRVLNAQGGTSTYVVNLDNVPVKTNFGQSGIAECTTNCIVEVITSIALPDGTSFSFLYDCDSSSGHAACNSPAGQSAYYGLLTSMTMPTGATVTYGYSNFKDAIGNVGRWLTSKYTSGQQWSLYPSVTSSTTQQVTVAKPDASQDVIAFTVDASGGTWPTQITSYDAYGATLLSTVKNTWDFSVACTLNLCGGRGHQDVRKLSTSTTLPVPGGSITKQTTYSYDSPQKGNVTAIKEWRYQAGTAPVFSSTPDRATYNTYATIGTNNNINRPLTRTVCNNVGTDADCPGGGSKVDRTVVTYDAYGSNGSQALSSVTGVVNHDDTAFGSSYTTRGNPTQVSRWINGTTYLTSAMSYDTTGQVVRVLDPNQNPKTYSYADVFYDDTGTNPPATHAGAPKTNAYATSVTDAIGTSSMGYYYATGQPALATDYDAVTTYSHYADLFNRPTEIDYPIGWVLNQYHIPVQGQTQIDSYLAVSDTKASASCVSCAHTQVVQDSLGRITTQSLLNNPAGPVHIYTTYDKLDRPGTISHLNFGSSDPNNVLESSRYDGLGRSLGVVHPDGQSVRVAYGASVQSAGGLGTQQGSSSTYGVGFPIVTTDEGGKQKQEWVDGFGRVIEVDEPGTGLNNGATTVTVNGTEEMYTYYPCGYSFCPTTGYDSGYVSVTVNGFTSTAGYSQGSTDSSVASALVTGFTSANSPVTATIMTGTCCTVLLQTKTPAATMPSFSTAAATYVPQYVSGPSFWPTPSSGTFTPQITNAAATFYTYDVRGLLTGVTEGTQTRTFKYDGLSRLTQEITPEGGTVTLSYVTASGALCSGNPSNPCTRIAPAPNQTGIATVTTTYAYNAANQLTSQAHSDTTGTETYNYGTNPAAFNVGRVTKMIDPSGSEGYTYDKIGRITTINKVVGSTTYSTKYAYNSGSQVTKLTYPSGRVVQYSYDNVGHLCLVAAATTNCTTSTTPYVTLPSASYDAGGRPLNATFGNGVVLTVAYTPGTSEMASLGYGKGTTQALKLNYYFQNDATNCPNGSATGNNTQIQCITDISSGAGDAGRSLAYTYDPLGRLLTAKTTGSSQYPAWGLAWTYDRYGNRTAQTVTAGSAFSSSFTINPSNNRITSPAFTYDGAGNVIAEPAPLSVQYTYDGEGCNTGYTGSASSASYTCDANHLRVKKVVTGTNAVTTVSIYSHGRIIAEYDNGAAVASPTREYLYAHNLLATVTGSTGGAGGTIIYQHRDHRSPRLYTDLNGNTVGEQATFPFGEPWYSNNTTSNWVFSTYERDKESGNDYALARSYASTQGRFLSPDPLKGRAGNPQSWNRYSYSLNDPINLDDPSGQGFWEDLFFAIADVFVAIFAPQALPDVVMSEAATSAGQVIIPNWWVYDAALSLKYGVATWIAWYGKDPPPAGSVAVPATDSNGQPTLLAQEGDIEDPEIERTEANTEVQWGTALEPVEPEPEPPASWSENSPVGVPIYNPFNGPLDYARVGKYFHWYYPRTLEKSEVFYRNWGGKSTLEGGPDGQWLSLFPQTGISARIDLAIGSWNTLENLDAVEVPAGSTVYIGPAAYQPGMNGFLLGGGIQVFVPSYCPVNP